MLMAMLILPEYLVVMTYHRPGKMMKRVRAMMTAVPVAIYVAGHRFLAGIFICESINLTK
jgi:hypothetical protein